MLNLLGFNGFLSTGWLAVASIGVGMLEVIVENCVILGCVKGAVMFGGGWCHLFDAFLLLACIACVKFNKPSAKFGGLVEAVDVYVFPRGCWGSISLSFKDFTRCCSSFVSMCGFWLLAIVFIIPSN